MSLQNTKSQIVNLFTNGIKWCDYILKVMPQRTCRNVYNGETRRHGRSLFTLSFSEIPLRSVRDAKHTIQLNEHYNR